MYISTTILIIALIIAAVLVKAAYDIGHDDGYDRGLIAGKDMEKRSYNCLDCTECTISKGLTCKQGKFFNLTSDSMRGRYCEELTVKPYKR